MPARPRLLFLSQTLPYPPDGGVKIRTYNILRQLAAAFDVTALCFYRSQKGSLTASVPDSVRALGAFGHVEAFPIPQEHHRGRLLTDHVRSVTTRRTYTVASYESADYRKRLEEVLAGPRFDLVHADSLDLSGYFPALDGVPIACTHHDVQSILLGRRAERQASVLQRAYLLHQSELMRKEEREWCPRVALNVTVSEVDRDQFRRIAPSGRYVVAPNGVDVNAFTPARGRDEGIVFVGGASWFPNLEAMQFFCDEILPHVRRRAPGAELTWVGRAAPDQQRHFQETHGIRVTGYVPDVRPLVGDAACFVVPIRVGGGTRIKILDAWAMGKAIVTTTIGCEGLAAVDGENILIRDSPEEFADAVIELLGSPDLRNRLGAAGRRTAETIYSWDAIGRDLIAEYQRLL